MGLGPERTIARSLKLTLPQPPHETTRRREMSRREEEAEKRGDETERRGSRAERIDMTGTRQFRCRCLCSDFNLCSASAPATRVGIDNCALSAVRVSVASGAGSRGAAAESASPRGARRPLQRRLQQRAARVPVASASDPHASSQSKASGRTGSERALV